MPGAPGRFAVGIVLGIIYWRTRSLWASYATHLTHDLILFAAWAIAWKVSIHH